MTWATNGFAGYIMVIDGKFSINADRGLLKPLKDNINITYIKNVLEPALRGLAKGRKGEKGEDEFTKVYPSMIENVEIKMPVNTNGYFDIDAQNEIVSKILFIQNLKQKIEEYKNQIEELNIEIASDFNYKEFRMSEIFDFQDGYAFPSSVYTSNTTDIKLIRIQDVNQKSVPKTVRIPTKFKFPNKDKYMVKNGDYLLSLSGAAGFNLIKWSGEQGYLNQRISKIKLKDNITEFFIDGFEEILINQIHSELNTLGKGANNNLSRKDILDIILKLPIDKKGIFDKESQREISDRYLKINNIKSMISKEMDKVLSVEIDYE